MRSLNIDITASCMRVLALLVVQCTPSIVHQARLAHRFESIASVQLVPVVTCAIQRTRMLKLSKIIDMCRQSFGSALLSS
jgi:hypothetical protein